MSLSVNLTIKNKLFFGFVCLFVLSIGLFLHNYLKLQDFSQRIERINSLRVPTQRIGSQLEDGVKRSQAQLTSWVLSRDETHEQQREQTWQEDILPIIPELEQLAVRWTEPANNKRLVKIKLLLLELRSWQSKIGEGDLSQAKMIELLTGTDKLFSDKLILIIQQMTESQAFLLKQDMTESQKEIETHLRQQFFWLFVVFCMGLIVVIVVMRNITQSVQRLKETANALAKSKLKPKIHQYQGDELSSVGHAMEAMALQLYEARQVEKHSLKEEAKDALRESELRFRQLAENINEVFWLCSPDWQEMFYISPAYGKDWGGDSALLYKNASSWMDRVHSDDRHILTEQILWAADKLPDTIDFDLYRIIKPNKEICWIKARAYAIKDEHGEVVRIAGIAEDITQIKNHADEQTEIYNSMLDAVIVINQDGKVLSFSPSAETLFGYQSDEVIGKNIKLLMPQGYAAGHDGYLHGHMNTGETNIIGKGREVEGLTKDDEVFPMHLSVVEISRGDDGKRRFLGSCHNLTTIHQQNKKLRSSQKMEALGKLTGGVSHDYNNMLSVIIGYAELLQLKLKDQPKLLKYVDEIAHAGERGAKLTKKLLSFSQNTSVSAKAVDINSTLEGDKLMLEKTLTARISLFMYLAKDIWPVWIEETDFEDVVLNLTINAMHAMADFGTLTIRTYNLINDHTAAEDPSGYANRASVNGLDDKDYVVLSIIDTGTGMSAAIQEKIFDPFFSTKGSEGTGLGLSQVYGFVQRCGGAINLQSKEGQGSQFDLYFPRYHDENDSTNVADTAINTDVLTGNETILVVDDEAALVTLAAEMLNSAGYQVLKASNSKQAMTILEQQTIDLLLTDVVMPEMDGYQLADFVVQAYPSIKIMLLSGYTGTETSSGRSSRSDYPLLLKPYQPTELMSKIRQILDEKHEAAIF